MKKLLILLFSILISFNSFGEWVVVNENDGGTQYIDFDTLKIVDDSVYVWSMRDDKLKLIYSKIERVKKE